MVLAFYGWCLDRALSVAWVLEVISGPAADIPACKCRTERHIRRSFAMRVCLHHASRGAQAPVLYGVGQYRVGIVSVVLRDLPQLAHLLSWPRTDEVYR